MREKHKVEQLPILWNMDDKSRQNVCLASCMTCSWCLSVICRSTITIENLLHFLEYFNENIYMKNFLLGFVKVRSTRLSSGFFAQMQKDLNEKRSYKYCQPSCILSRSQVRFQVSSIILTLERPRGGGIKWNPHRFFGPKIWSFQAIKMKLSVPVVW